MLAKNSQVPRSFRKPALSLTFFASKLAPTQGLHHCTSTRCTCNPNCSYACTSGASHSVINV
ncbi:hypothetical protein CER19_18565 [Pseudomonas sp. GL93]|nr:hypothetical protein CER19_18565 [Pseudomonas sp. GL93]